ncbi:T-cell receptor-associated transmembrane adapter 1 [Dasypus novemcinctus]|uniref:T-cell receptor-associated transmembrane adapter 1 n=1 Tax=Dasypus novemcinctus TaxID=9361 RepID=UPI0000E37E45|nr:T-cell receptor-associated transmembrane adapter 1 [Dasypus novemcinctus]
MSENSECPFLVWGLLVFFCLALVISLIFNISHYVKKQKQGEIYKYSDDFIPRIDEYYIEDTPIYGNLDNVVPEPVDENCYEQMKAHPMRSLNKQEAAPATQAVSDTQMCYASLDHNYKGKCRKPRKPNTHLLDKDKDEQLHATDASISKTTLVDSLPPESQEIEENIHDDPIRLFELIHAEREPVN